MRSGESWSEHQRMNRSCRNHGGGTNYDRRPDRSLGAQITNKNNNRSEQALRSLRQQLAVCALVTCQRHRAKEQVTFARSISHFTAPSHLGRLPSLRGFVSAARKVSSQTEAQNRAGQNPPPRAAPGPPNTARGEKSAKYLKPEADPCVLSRKAVDDDPDPKLSFFLFLLLL